MRRRGTGVGRSAVPRTVVGGAAVVVLALLGGCTGDARPTEPTTSVTADPTPTSSPTPTPMALPTPPSVMAEPTTDGAIAAGTHFIALYDYAFSVGDVAPLMAMSAASCEFCSYVRDQVTTMVDDGYSTVAQPLAISASDSTEIREDEWFRVHLTVEQGALDLVSPDGTVQRTSEGSTVDFIFAISWLGDAWRVEGVDVVEPAA